MSDDITTTLDRLQTAAAEEAYDDLIDLEEQLFEVLEARRTEERVTVEQAKAVLERGGLEEEHEEALSTLVRASVGHSLSETGFIGSARLSTADPANADLDEFITAIEGKREDEAAFGRALDDAAEALEEVPIPARIVLSDLSGPEPFVVEGARFDVSTTVRNVGDVAVEGLAVDVESEDGVEVSAGAVDLGTAGGGTATAVTVSATATSPGTNAVRLIARADGETVAEERLIVRVESMQSLVEAALDNLDGLQSLAAELSHRGIQRSLEAKLDGAERQLSRARDAVETGRTEQAGERLGTATNHLGALLNELHSRVGGASEENSSEGGRIAPAVRSSLRSQTEALIDQVATARDAAP